MRRDLGTYYVRVELADGRGYIDRWTTGYRFSDGTHDVTTADATLIPPTWESEEELRATMVWMYTEGNYSCDCNKTLSLARAHHQPEPHDPPCGDTMTLQRLTMVRPDVSEVVIFESTRDPE